MSIPARVAAEAAQADIQLAELAAAANAAKNPPAVETPPVAAAPAAPAPATPQVQPLTDPSDEIRRLAHQLGTVQGRLEAATTQNQQLLGRVEELSRQAPTPAPTPAPAPVVQLITDKDREDYGDDLLGLIARAVQQAIGTRFDDIGNRLAGLEGRIGNTQQQVKSVQEVAQQSVAEKYIARLTAEVPDWEVINEDPDFIDWLNKKDILAGKTRFAVLEDAHNRAETETVVHIFRLYKQEKGTGTPAPTPAPPAPAPASHIDPNTLAAPATTPPTPPPTNPPVGRIWSKDEVDKLYEDKQKGRITLTDFDKQEKEYFKALAEGRVSAT